MPQTSVFDQNLKAAVTTTKVLELTNGSTLNVGYDQANSKVLYEASVKVGTYLGMGFGSSMTDTDMIAWEAGSTASTSSC